MNRSRPPLLCLAAAAAAAFVLAGWRAHLRLNLSGSMPAGLWRIETASTSIEPGQIVSVCLPAWPASMAVERGYIGRGECPTDVEPLIKPVVAVAGDEIVVSESGLSVNGRAIEGTAQRRLDTVGRPLWLMPAGTYDVSPGSIWVASGHDPRSFDSRYFGPVPTDNVRGIAVPVFVTP